MEEALTLQQRIKRSRIMKAKSKMIARKREISMRRRASSGKLKQRASKAARKIIQNKLLKNRDKDELSFVSREKLEKMVDKKKSIIQKIAKRLLPSIRQKESDRLQKRKGGDK
jgi:hypothetical protein